MRDLRAVAAAQRADQCGDSPHQEASHHCPSYRSLRNFGVVRRKHLVMTTSRSGYDVSRLPDSRVNALAEAFTPEERHVILHQGTERPFCGLLLDNKQPGTYVCRLCGLPLFASNAKFESGTGWPSFFQPFDPEHV